MGIKKNSILSVILLAVVIYFLSPFLQNPEFKSILLSKQNWLNAQNILFLALYLIIVHLVALGWFMSLKIYSNAALRFRDILFLFFKANIGKYIPGNIFEISIRTILSKKYALSIKSVLQSSALETLLGIGALGAVSLMALVYLKNNALLISLVIHFFKQNRMIIFAVVSSLVLTSIYLFKYKRDLFIPPQFSRKKQGMVILTFTLYCLIQTLSSALFVLIFQSKTGHHFSTADFFNLGLGYLASYSIGYLIPIAPSGLGVRESALLICLQGFGNSSEILAVSIFHRIICILGDLILFGVSSLRKQS